MRPMPAAGDPFTATPPALSVVLVVGPRRDRAAGCLQRLLAQEGADRLEVVLVDLGAGTLPAVGGSDHPTVRTLPLPPATLFAEARAHGVRAARAPLVAFLEEHSRPRPGWAAALVRAFAGPWAAVGPVMYNANPGVGRSDVTFLMSYGLFFPPLPAGEAAILPGHNSAYRRAVLLSYGDELPRLLASDNVMMAVLRRDGHRLFLEPAMGVEHLNESSLASIAPGYFAYHRCYGHYRSTCFAWPWWRRFAYAALTPLIPLYYLLRFSLFLRRRQSPFLAVLIRHGAFVYAAQLVSAAGQALGLLFGPGDAERRFTAYELTEPRPLASEVAVGG
jgi:cellulose synthase/poly-beta-1,6-N-acetylglucosamine synthase-like glycosyltransferase